MPDRPPDDESTPVTCATCEACCCRLPVLLLPDDRPPGCFIDVDEHGSRIMGKGEDGWCVALDRNNMNCSIYAQRPWVCRYFAMAGQDCREVRADYRRIAHSLC